MATALKEWRELVKPSTGLWEDSFLASLANADAERICHTCQPESTRKDIMRAKPPTIPPEKPEPKSNDCTTCGGAKVVPSGDRRGTKTCPTCGGTGKK